MYQTTTTTMNIRIHQDTNVVLEASVASLQSICCMYVLPAALIPHVVQRIIYKTTGTSFVSHVSRMKSALFMVASM